jgi:hypothetical protein
MSPNKEVAEEPPHDLQLRAAVIELLTRRKDAESCRGKYGGEAQMNKEGSAWLVGLSVEREVSEVGVKMHE